MNEITFSIRGEPYTQIVDWRRRTDYLVIKHQIETRGRAIVLHSRERGGLHQITELPEIGTVVPWYGESGMGYAYVFMPESNGCHVWVEAQASQSFFYSGVIASLEFHIVDRLQVLAVPESSDLRHDFEDTGQAFIFRITGRNYQQLAAWPAFSEALDVYVYRFIPTTVGVLIAVTQPATAESTLLEEHYG
jgi:hypothetical protein